MSEFRGYTPPEAMQESSSESKSDAGLTPETIRGIQDGPPAAPEPDVQPYSIETVEGAYRSPEALPEKEPGLPYKPSLGDAPGDDPGSASSDDSTSDVATSDDSTSGGAASDVSSVEP